MYCFSRSENDLQQEVQDETVLQAETNGTSALTF
jgi:hypothetical protein